MVKSKLLFCSEGVIVDRETGKVSAFNILETLSVVSFPFFIPKLDVFHILERGADDDETYSCALRVKLDDETLLEEPLVLNFKGGLRTRWKIELSSFGILRPGTLEFLFLVGENAIASYQVQVKKIGGVMVEKEEV